MADFSIAEAKIHILYIVDAVPGVSYHMLMEALINSLYMDFFTFSQAYNELIAGNLMDALSKDTGTGETLGQTEVLNITAGGRAILKDLMPSLNKVVISHLDSVASSLSEQLNQLYTSTANIELTEDGLYSVNLFSDNSGKPFSCVLTVSSSDEAKKICRAWRKSDAAAISSFLKSLNSNN